jgi:membrane-bound lytic murein transglycosylase D
MDQESSHFVALGKAEAEIESAAVDELENLDLIPIVVDPDLRDSLVSDLAEAKFEIPITINERVLKSLKYWLDSGRKRLEDGLIRSGRYRPIIEKIFREESIPVDLLYLAQVESRFKPHAVSKAQAKGIWQFRRSTAIRYGLKVTRDVDERSDPEKSTRAAARYLKDLYAMFGDWNLALAAYNWGEGKVRRLIQSTGVEDFWQLANLKRKVPAETKNHVSLILACVVIGNNPAKYGFPTQLDPPIDYDRVSVSKPIDLRAAAKTLGISVDALKGLNPAIRRFYTPSNYPGFQLKIPVNSDPGVQGKLAALPKAVFKPPADFNGRHKIQQGETLSEIAVLYNVSVAELERANDLQSRHKIRAGSWLYVPPKPEIEKSASQRFISPARLPNLFTHKPEAGKTEVVVTEIHGPPRNGSAKP